MGYRASDWPNFGWSDPLATGEFLHWGVYK